MSPSLNEVLNNTQHHDSDYIQHVLNNCIMIYGTDRTSKLANLSVYLSKVTDYFQIVILLSLLPLTFLFFTSKSSNSTSRVRWPHSRWYVNVVIMGQICNWSQMIQWNICVTQPYSVNLVFVFYCIFLTYLCCRQSVKIILLKIRLFVIFV